MRRHCPEYAVLGWGHSSPSTMHHPFLMLLRQGAIASFPGTGQANFEDALRMRQTAGAVSRRKALLDFSCRGCSAPSVYVL